MSLYIRLFLVLAFVFVPVLAFADDAPKQYVLNVSDQVIAVVKNTSLSDPQKESKLTDIFNQTVDATWMGKFVLGKYFKTATPAQQEKYLSLYRQYLVKSYVPKFRKYTGEKISITGVTPSGNESIVHTEIVNADKSKPAVAVDYRLKPADGGFKVIDIVGEGVSLINTQRSDFGGAISTKGLDGFLTMLEQKVKQMAKN